MGISTLEVRKIAALARLHFSDEEVVSFSPQFQHILDYIDKLKEVNVEGVEPTSHLAEAGGSELPESRPDEAQPSLSAEDALRNAPDAGNNHFRVPKVF